MYEVEVRWQQSRPQELAFDTEDEVKAFLDEELMDGFLADLPPEWVDATVWMDGGTVFKGRLHAEEECAWWSVKLNGLGDFFVNTYADEAIWRIANNGRPLLWGDESSMRVIFNNIAGRNIKGEEHAKYLRWARSRGLEPGEVALVRGGEELEKARV